MKVFSKLSSAQINIILMKEKLIHHDNNNIQDIYLAMRAAKVIETKREFIEFHENLSAEKRVRSKYGTHTVRSYNNG